MLRYRDIEEFKLVKSGKAGVTRVDVEHEIVWVRYDFKKGGKLRGQYDWTFGVSRGLKVSLYRCPRCNSILKGGMGDAECTVCYECYLHIYPRPIRVKRG